MTRSFNKSVMLCSLVLGTCFSAPTYADNAKEYRITAAGMLGFSNPQFENTRALNESSKTGLGGGGALLFGTSFIWPLQMETGLIYTSRSNDFGNSNFSFSQTSNWLQIPVGVKLKVIELVSVGAGGYVGYRVGDVTNSFSLGDSTLAGGTASTQERLEVGLYGTAGVTIPVADKVGLLIEARYRRGLTNLSQDTNNNGNVKSSDLMGLVGAQFTI